MFPLFDTQSALQRLVIQANICSLKSIRPKENKRNEFCFVFGMFLRDKKLAKLIEANSLKEKNSHHQQHHHVIGM